MDPASPASVSVTTELASFKFKASNAEDDAIDEMLETYIRTNKVRVPIQRIDQSKYLFGTRVIIAAIQNGALLVRVGGGFMTIDELV